MSRTWETNQQLGLDDGIERRPSHSSIWRMTHVRRFTSASSTLRVPEEEPVLSQTPLLDDAPLTVSEDTSWYNRWVWHQVEGQPEELYSVMSNPKAEAKYSCINSFVAIWRGVWVQAMKSDSSVNDIITHHLQQGLLRLENDASLGCARNLLFAIIGQETMLYSPNIGARSPAQLAIVDETDGRRGQAHICLRQHQTGLKEALHEFPWLWHAAALSEFNTVSSASLNAHLLTSVGGIHTKWTDSLRQQQLKTILHTCAALHVAASHWVTSDEMNDLLQEVLLSYSPLFGQSKTSRQLFHALKLFEDLPEESQDRGLLTLCGEKRYGYVLARDFPVLRSIRFAVLIIGGIGIILAFLQVILQTVQVSLHIKHP
ncbi:hypothetical protein K469DRAFT_729148 [Zopfia rhizophila CBS 207.26]|uniref:Uncharacterized protein n=1 Tax=Zopfia rhizophila CBS 207.26 TaxID=1314779 RepID=A0A6A6DR68_9PEZI|nr:hypothetical protein K469DRAFT_729148 [Zopfia rhizophila CBS 207.26]